MVALSFSGSINWKYDSLGWESHKNLKACPTAKGFKIQMDDKMRSDCQVQRTGNCPLEWIF